LDERDGRFGFRDLASARQIAYRTERSLYQRANGYNYEAVKIFMPANREKPVYALGTTPMIGFDPVGVSREFSLSDNEVPALLVAVGNPTEANWPQSSKQAR
jgi:hypothetical protein